MPKQNSSAHKANKLIITDRENNRKEKMEKKKTNVMYVETFIEKCETNRNLNNLAV